MSTRDGGPDWPPLVELVDLPGHEPAADTPAPEPARPYRRRSAVTAVVMSTVLLIGAAVWLALDSRTRHVVRTVRAPVTTGLDASGCPVGAQCRLDALPESALYREAQRWFPDDDIVFGSSVRDVDARTVYRQTVVIRTGAGYTVLAVASCVPHGEAIVLPSSVAVDPESESTVQTVIVPGARAGCSTAVSSRTSARNEQLLGAMTRLAQDGANYG